MIVALLDSCTASKVSFCAFLLWNFFAVNIEKELLASPFRKLFPFFLAVETLSADLLLLKLVFVTQNCCCFKCAVIEVQN